MNMKARWLAATPAVILCLALRAAVGVEPAADAPWPLHVIDGSSQGADGVRLADVNGDNLPDIATGWEQGGVTRVYLHPGHALTRQTWPAVTVGQSPNVEDAVLADLDQDGAYDVVSCCEGRTRNIFIHWRPPQGQYLNPAAWKTTPLTPAAGRMAWMYCVPSQIDGRHGLDLITGGKGRGAEVGWFEAPADARNMDGWKWHSLSPAGWIMSLVNIDMDADGDEDILLTDRYESLSGCRWLENPGQDRLDQPWANHWVGGRGRENMFLTVADLDGDQRPEVITAVKPQVLLCLKNGGDPKQPWKETEIALPEFSGTAKGGVCGDLDADGRPDLVFSCEQAKGELPGVMWMRQSGDNASPTWQPRAISGPNGIKFDRIELLDLDGDDDLDVLTCEEQEHKTGIGVFWYENHR